MKHQEHGLHRVQPTLCDRERKREKRKRVHVFGRDNKPDLDKCGTHVNYFPLQENMSKTEVGGEREKN